MARNAHRVVVELTDMEDIDTTVRSRASPTNSKRTEKLVKADVQLIDSKTLQLTVQDLLPNVKTRQYERMHFDCVGKCNDTRIRSEIGSICEQLLQGQNCCLLKFSPQKEALPFVCGLLVSEVDKRMQMQRACIHTIKLEYYDIRKYDVVNLLGDDKRPKRQTPTRTQFSTIMELQKWLQSEYPTLWSSGLGHDCLDLQFHFADTKHRRHKVKFSFFSIYHNKMDIVWRKALHNFLENEGNEQHFKRTLLTDCLLEYYGSGKDVWLSWMLFDVPVMKNGGGSNVTEEMLILANAAFTGESTHPSTNIPTHPVDSDMLATVSHPQYVIKRSVRGRLAGGVELRKSRSQHSSTQSLQSKDYSSRDYNSLSYWYCKMDEKFSTVVRAMEDYYNHKYNARVSRICGEVKHMARTIEQKSPVRKPSGELPMATKLHETEMQLYFNNYRLALIEFRHLAKDIEQSHYDELLHVYLKTKSFELAQHAMRFKVKHLENCQQRLASTISEEVNLLNKMKRIFKMKPGSSDYDEFTMEILK